MKLKIILVGCAFFNVVNCVQAQEFVNGDLEGVVTTLSEIAPSWTGIPFTDVNCLATDVLMATADLTDLTGPFAVIGLNGNPLSGNSFMCGLYQISGTNTWHEGFMQQVSGFIPGNSYPINFHQAVLKQGNATDSTGSWSVYIDSTLVGISTPSFNSDPWDTIYVTWEPRTLNFTASSNTHMIKFLPFDDDANVNEPNGVRMAIDCIYINTPCSGISGINSLTENSLVSVHPNPVIDNLTVKVDLTGVCELIIYDLTARKISDFSFENSLVIPVEHLRKGIYFYELRMKNEILQKGKFVKE